MIEHDPRKIVVVQYKNFRGEVAVRRIVPKSIRFTSTEWHPAEQWVMEAIDVDRGVERSFAIKDIIDWNATA